MKVLILEDDGGSREILEHHLQDRKIECHTTADRHAALRSLDNRPVDVVLTDIHLPGARGTDHIRDFCQHSSKPLVLVMTGFPSLETCLDSLHFGAEGYMVKPFKVSEFIELAEKGLARRQELSALRDRVTELEAELSRLNGADSK
jgi:DNA-binding response OmpR family regulator